MKTSSLLKIVILLTAMVSMVAGCGSGGSVAVGNTNSNTTADGTGSITANLAWSGSGSAKSTSKTLYLTPSGVVNVRITVSAPGISSIVKTFSTTPGTAGTGTVDNIPVGPNRTITVWGMDSGGTIRYQGSKSGININLGQTTDAGTITMIAPVSSASPIGKHYSTARTVTISTNVTPATIYYTTSGVDPTTSSLKSASPFDILLETNTTLKFFAIDSGFAVESTIHTETYTIP